MKYLEDPRSRQARQRVVMREMADALRPILRPLRALDDGRAIASESSETWWTPIDDALVAFERRFIEEWRFTPQLDLGVQQAVMFKLIPARTTVVGAAAGAPRPSSLPESSG